MAVDMPRGYLERLRYCHGLASRFNRETEELADFYVHRRLAAVIVAVMGMLDMPWLFTPNRITVVSLLTGVASAICVLYAVEDNVMFLWAAGLELLSITFDCCDGQLARMYGSGSLVGRILDGLSDLSVALSHGFAWVYVFIQEGVLTWQVAIALLVFTAVSYQQQAMMFDRIKNLFCLKSAPKKDSKVVGLEESELIEQEMQKALDSKSYVSYGLLRWYKTTYLVVQDTVAHKSVQDHYQEAANLNPEEYRLKWRSTMRLVSWCGTGTHSFMFYSLLFVSFLAADIRVLLAWFALNNVVQNAIFAVCWVRVQKM